MNTLRTHAEVSQSGRQAHTLTILIVLAVTTSPPPPIHHPHPSQHLSAMCTRTAAGEQFIFLRICVRMCHICRIMHGAVRACVRHFARVPFQAAMTMPNLCDGGRRRKVTLIKSPVRAAATTRRRHTRHTRHTPKVNESFGFMTITLSSMGYEWPYDMRIMLPCMALINGAVWTGEHHQPHPLMPNTEMALKRDTSHVHASTLKYLNRSGRKRCLRLLRRISYSARCGRTEMMAAELRMGVAVVAMMSYVMRGRFASSWEVNLIES